MPPAEHDPSAAAAPALVPPPEVASAAPEADGEVRSHAGRRRRRGRRRLPLFRRRFTKPGAPPGRFAGPPVPGSARLRILRFDGERWEQREDVPLTDLPPVDEQHLTWLDLRGVQDHAAVRAVGEHLKLHPLALADIVNVGQRPKLESYEEDELFIVMRMAVRAGATDQEPEEQAGWIPGFGRRREAPPAAPQEDDAEADEAVFAESWHWEQLCVFVGEGFVATFQESEGDCLEPVRRRLRRHAFVGAHTTVAGGLAAVILDAVVDNYFPLLEHLSERLEVLEDEVVDRPERAVLGRIYQIKRDLLTFRRAAWPLRDALADLGRAAHPLVPEEIKPFVRDTADHAVQVVDVVESYRELAASFVEVYLSSITQRTNEVMRVLTIIATIFIPLTFLAGVYGMNFEYLPEKGWKWSYPLFWLTCLAVTGGMLFGFWRLGWIGRRRKW